MSNSALLCLSVLSANKPNSYCHFVDLFLAMHGSGWQCWPVSQLAHHFGLHLNVSMTIGFLWSLDNVSFGDFAISEGHPLGTKDYTF